MYKELAEINQLMWREDDMMSQETLFEMQDKMAKLLLQVAEKEKKTGQLVKDFPWLYQISK